MKILCLILASDTSPEYIQFQSLWRRFMHLRREVDCYFYKGHPDLTQPAFLHDRTLWIKVNENLDSVYEKTLRAFEYFVPELDKYDFVYRSNLSTFVSFEHLIQYCKDLPKTNCCAARTGGLPPEDEDKHSIDRGGLFPAGNGFILSTDLVRRLVTERVPRVIQDDVTIGVALRLWGVTITELVRPDFLEHGSWFMNNEHLLTSPSDRNLNPKKMMFMYRLKSYDRQKDMQEMDRLIRANYNV